MPRQPRITPQAIPRTNSQANGELGILHGPPSNLSTPPPSYFRIFDLEGEARWGLYTHNPRAIHVNLVSMHRTCDVHVGTRARAPSGVGFGLSPRHSCRSWSSTVSDLRCCASSTAAAATPSMWSWASASSNCGVCKRRRPTTGKIHKRGGQKRVRTQTRSPAETGKQEAYVCTAGRSGGSNGWQHWV